ncbi:MAG: 3-hydroxyacyl-CoA dehydrogenase family protein [Candidatus Latescibacterota bacterium]|nr:3-hydroxyacyl-CoA dehydrogenase family protein [Candidatus Latescibacterota bacterium]
MKNNEIQNISVIGAGFLGTQIGLQCAAHGLSISLVDPSRNSRKHSMNIVKDELAQRVSKGLINSNEEQTILSRMNYTSDLKKGVTDAELVIEAVPESLDLKRDVFAKLDKLTPTSTILATNSSSIKISAIETATQRPDAVLNMHFYGMIWERPMVELMRGTKTSGHTIDTVFHLAKRINVTPLVVDAESTGFIFNRVWRAIKRESLHLVNDGVTSHENVDRAWMIFTGMNMGPFALMDRIGLDVIQDIENVYFRESKDDRDMPPSLLTKLVKRGDLGCKTGKGFYSYPNPAFDDPDWIRGGDSQ